MPEHVIERHVKSGRKKYWCHDCGEIIEIGQPRLVNTWAEGRHIYSWHTCPKCEEFLGVAWKWIRSVSPARGEQLRSSLTWDDGYEIHWLRDSFREGLTIAGLVFRDRAEATSFLKEQLNQVESV